MFQDVPGWQLVEYMKNEKRRQSALQQTPAANSKKKAVASEAGYPAQFQMQQEEREGGRTSAHRKGCGGAESADHMNRYEQADAILTPAGDDSQ